MWYFWINSPKSSHVKPWHLQVKWYTILCSHICLCSFYLLWTHTEPDGIQTSLALLNEDTYITWEKNYKNIKLNTVPSWSDAFQSWIKDGKVKGRKARSHGSSMSEANSAGLMAICLPKAAMLFDQIFSPHKITAPKEKPQESLFRKYVCYNHVLKYLDHS